jgi:YidC/Oxa1 family membrane protein insertase
MQSLQIHAPEMKAIQQRYKHDRQKQSEELMKFYRENKINPYASCLPIVFQIPIFIALFFVLRDFKGEVFCDPELGGEQNCETVDGDLEPTAEGLEQLEWLNLVNITADTVDGWGPLLLVVYVISQLTSTWLMSTAMQSAAQRWLIMLLPIVFIPFILNFPSGLMIYWLTTNLWTTGQGIVTRRLMPRPVAAPPKRSSRTPPREAAAAVARDEQATDGGTGSTAPARQGPPRRVKRKKGGGGRKR